MKGILTVRTGICGMFFLVSSLCSQNTSAQETVLHTDDNASYAEAMSICSEHYDTALSVSGTLTPISGPPGTMAVWVLQPETRYCHLTDKTVNSGAVLYKNIEFYTLHKAFYNGEWVYAGGLPIVFKQLWYVAGTESPIEASAPSCGVSAGNPIDTLTGNKYESVSDISAGYGGISFRRHYNSAISSHYRYLGRGWTYTFSSGIYPSPFDDSLILVNDRGFSSIYRKQNGSNVFLNEHGEAIERIDVGGVLDSYIHTPSSGGVLSEVYGSKGQLLARRTASETALATMWD